MTNSDPDRSEERCSFVMLPDPKSIISARLFTASVARLWGFDEDDVDDLRLAVSELTTAAVRVGAAEISVEAVRPPGGGFRLEVAPLTAADLDEDPLPTGDLIEAMFDDVVVADGRVVISLDEPT